MTEISATGSTTKKGTAVNTRKGLNDGEKAEIKSLFNTLGLFRAIRRDMPLQYVITLLIVALDEGQSVMEYARTLGISPSVMSRHLLDIGERNRRMAEGFGLVTYRPNPMNLREHQVFLTPKGQALIHQVIRSLR